MSHTTTGYPSDLTEEQWAIIGPLVMKPRQGPGRPVMLDLRLVVNAILYGLRTGCPWAYLPREYPNFNRVYYHFRKWSWDGTWEWCRESARLALHWSRIPLVWTWKSPCARTVPRDLSPYRISAEDAGQLSL